MRSSRLAHEAPASGRLLYWLGRLWFFLTGWKATGEVPPGRRFVLIAAPHTTNWDLPFTLAAAFVYRIRISWLGKKSLFRFPFGPFMRWLGGIPVDRGARLGVVAQIADRFAAEEALMVAVPPAGTRSRGEGWKSGFYWIAREAGVPILCGTLDYGRKEANLGLCLRPTGNLGADMDRIREYYRDVSGLYPENQTPVRLKEEEDAAS